MKEMPQAAAHSCAYHPSQCFFLFFFLFAQLRLGTTQFQKFPVNYFNSILDERRLGEKACSAGKPSVSRTMDGLLHAWVLLIEGFR